VVKISLKTTCPRLLTSVTSLFETGIVRFSTPTKSVKMVESSGDVQCYVYRRSRPSASELDPEAVHH
jgi:hypothetical protein